MEFVYVVPRSALFPDHYPHGLVRFAEAPGPGVWTGPEFAALVRREAYFVERAWAERTPSVKQLIPYSIVAFEDDDGPRVLLTQRLRGGGEARLHGKLSIGIGGHVNPVDAPAAAAARDPIAAATGREIREELAFEGPVETRVVGLLNDDSNPVGAVHVGVVQLVRLPRPVEVRERESLSGRWVTPATVAELRTRGSDFETWSALLIPELGRLLPCPAPARA